MSKYNKTALLIINSINILNRDWCSRTVKVRIEERPVRTPVHSLEPNHGYSKWKQQTNVLGTENFELP
jgi:hypothetical protein